MSFWRQWLVVRRANLACLALAVVLVGMPAGCVPVQRLAAPEVPEARQVALFFELRGRISVRVGDRIDAGQIRWTRSMGAEEMGFFSPVGTQLARVSRNGAGPARMQRGDEVVEAANLDELAGRLLGFPIGLDRIAAWAQGVGLVEGVEVEAFAAAGEPWSVLAEGLQAAPPYRFAHRLMAVRGDMVFKLVIDEWRALP